MSLKNYGLSYRTNPNTGYTVGRYIRESRLAWRMGARRAAALAGISPYRFKQYETDQRCPDPDSLWALVQALQMRPTEAFRCARMPGAWLLSDTLDNPPHLFTDTDRQEMEHYLDNLTGRDPDGHLDRAA